MPQVQRDPFATVPASRLGHVATLAGDSPNSKKLRPTPSPYSGLPFRPYVYGASRPSLRPKLNNGVTGSRA